MKAPKKKYKNIKWTNRLFGSEHEYHQHFDSDILDHRRRRTYCVTCNEVIHESITEHYYQYWFTGKEREHLASESHKNMVELARLA